VKSDLTQVIRPGGWRAGLTPTSKHTSLSRPAVKSQTLLWQIDGSKATTGTTESMLHTKGLPQLDTSTRYSRLTGCHPNLKHRASRNFPLGKANPCSAMRRVVNQHDAPRSEAASKARRKCGGKRSEVSLPEQINHCGERSIIHICSQ